MSKIFIPALKAEDWRQLLADPEKQWKKGYSARTIAYSWQDAGGVPPEITVILSQIPLLNNLQTIFAIPEHKVPLPGGSRPSQNDVWALCIADAGLVSMAVEGKVSEPFGPTIEEWFKPKTQGKEKRLKFLCKELGLKFPPPLSARYQLFHRTVSAIIEAKRFKANEAIMVVHTFSPTDEWFQDYAFFVGLFGLKAGINSVCRVNIAYNLALSFAWVHGNEKYLKL